MEKILSISFKKQYVDILLLLIKDVGNRKYIEELTYFSQFIFTYNNITNTNPNSDYVFDKFIFGQTVVIQF